MKKKQIFDTLINSDVMEQLISHKLKQNIKTLVKEIDELKSKDKTDYVLYDINNLMDDIQHLTKTYYFMSGDYAYKPKYFEEEVEKAA